MKKILVSALAVSAMLLTGDLLAQTSTTTTTKTTTKTTAKTHTAKAHTTTSSHTTASTRTRARLYGDVTRLEAILQEITQSNVSFSAATWRSTANEANMLANRVYSSAAASHNKAAITAARNLRMHVREMRTAALASDAAGAKTHATAALPFAYTLVDFSHPTT